jgi:hypothetical protein
MPSMPRPQFRLSTLLWLTLAVACWFGGMRFERYRFDQRVLYEVESRGAAVGSRLDPVRSADPITGEP